MSNATDKRSAERIIWGCLCLAVFGLCIARYWPILFPHAIALPATRPSETIGDEFNALGAIFTLLAFIAVMGALLLQRKDLDLQRQNLELQREDSQLHKSEAAAQQNTIAKEQVRREVFQLMDAWQEVVHHTAYKVETDGRLAFSVMSETLRDRLNRERDGRPLSKSIVQTAYEDFYQERFKAALGHYFRLLYHILRYIDHSHHVLDWKERKQLSRLIRAHLSEPEFHLLFWNGLTVHGAKMFRLIEKYDLLQNFSFSPHYVLDDEIKLYPRTYQRLVERRQQDAQKNQPG